MLSVCSVCLFFLSSSCQGPAADTSQHTAIKSVTPRSNTLVRSLYNASLTQSSDGIYWGSTVQYGEEQEELVVKTSTSVYTVALKSYFELLKNSHTVQLYFYSAASCLVSVLKVSARSVDAFAICSCIHLQTVLILVCLFWLGILYCIFVPLHNLQAYCPSKPLMHFWF